MSEEKSVEAKAEVVNETEKRAASLVDAVSELGTAWAEYGLSYGRFALENVAKALTRSAKALETLQEKIKKEEKAA